jgi:hypothetical protein
MTADEIAAAQNSVESGITLLTSLFGGNIVAIFYVVALLAVWGIFAFLVRRLTSVTSRD